MSRIQGTGRFALFCGAVLSMALVVACGGYEGQLSGQDGFLNTAAARVISLAGESAAIVSSATAVPASASSRLAQMIWK